MRTANSAFNIGVVIGVLLLLIFSCYALWDSAQVYSHADAKQYEKYKPTTKAGKLSFQELQAMNKDVCAWLEVYGTHIDYPVVQGKDNLRYINTNAEGRYSLSGALFLDYNNKRDFSDFASIIYGHHMEEEAMFGEIGFFANKNYFDVRKYGSLYYEGKKYGLEFFAFVHADAYDSRVFRTWFGDEGQRQAYLDLIVSRATNVRKEVKVTSDDRLVLLSTCSGSSTNGRDILVGRIIGQVPADPFRTTDTRQNSGALADRLSNLWAQAPFWLRGVILTLPFLLAFLLLALIYRRKRARQAKYDPAPDKRDKRT